MPKDDWESYQALVLSDIKRLNEQQHRQLKKIQDQNEKIQVLNIAVAQLQVKASLWGGIFGVAAALLLDLLKP